MIAKLLVALAVAYLGWRFWHGWGRPLPGTPKHAVVPPAPRSETDARAVLGVGPEADAEAIRAAHRRLIAAVHPDRGGSADLTARVNQARDLLLGRTGH